MKTAVMFLFFRRPEQTGRVFERIREARPPRLYLIADGPRPGVADDQPLAGATRAVVERVDWPCEVIRDYSGRNLGVQRRMVSGIDLTLEREEEAIILEDDCLPHPSFFRWCEEMLDRYRDEERVMHISGSQLLRESPNGGASYHFTRYVHIWGWATWRRAWRHYDGSLNEWHALRRPGREACLRRWFSADDERNYWRYVWDKFATSTNWSAQWSYACIARDALAITPNRNMISNVGFGADATNAREDPLGIANRPLEGISFPLVHPGSIEADARTDAATSHLFRISTPPPPSAVREPLRRRVWAAILRAGGRVLDFVPTPIRPRIRHRDRRPPGESAR